MTQNYLLLNSLKFDSSGFGILNISKQNIKMICIKKEGEKIIVAAENSSPVTLVHDSYGISLQDLK